MRYSEMNERQKKAFRNIKYAAQQYIGGLENIMMDNNEDSELYKSAEDVLNNHDELVQIIYENATTNYYTGESEYFGPQVELMLRDIRFCGKEWLMERVEKAVAKEGY